jgi:phosphatidylglycerol:prolipoprotein diacylglycerol transferase
LYPYLTNWVINGHLVRIPSFGFFLSFAMSSAYFLGLRNARLLGVSHSHIEKLFLIVLAMSALGARLFHVFLEEPSFYFSHPGKIFAFWEGGYTLYGGIICGSVGLFLYCWKGRISFWRILDIAALSTLLGIGIGRIGCFAAGCCWGKICHLPWAVTYTHPDVFNTIKNTPVHPTQLYESVGAFVCLFFLQKSMTNMKFPGELGLIAIALYATLRFFIEYLRGDSYRGFVIEPWLSYSQLISLVLILVALSGVAALSRFKESSS